MAGCCECGNEPSGSIKCEELFDQLRTVWFLKKDFLHGVCKSVNSTTVPTSDDLFCRMRNFRSYLALAPLKEFPLFSSDLAYLFSC
jgi:hypothetical protein